MPFRSGPIVSPIAGQREPRRASRCHQADNAVRVTERGAGVAISRRSASRRIAKAVAEVLGDERYRRAAARLGDQVARDAAGGALLDELEAAPPSRHDPATGERPVPEAS
ncbi:hypothetical protein [Agromyces laixinhei]|uniref:hypothetical protein n=1 Tax=Agromyces laixinhei TaxID=2585717 RepID=UPI0012ED706E|nr:hypothetical protein [Agromyces laixinhei]